MALDLSKILNPQTLFGSGLVAAGSLLDREGGEELEARQALRNISNLSGNNLLGTTSGRVRSAFAPELSEGPGRQFLTKLIQSPSDPFASGGAFELSLPFLKQQENELLDEIQQRAIAGLPASLGTAMGGPELAAIRSATANYLLPRRQALIADLLREQQGRQISGANQLIQDDNAKRNFVGDLTQFGINAPSTASSNLLKLSQPDPFPQALANLGTLIAASNLGSGTGSGGLDIGSIFGGGTRGAQGAGGTTSGTIQALSAIAPFITDIFSSSGGQAVSGAPATGGLASIGGQPVAAGIQAGLSGLANRALSDGILGKSVEAGVTLPGGIAGVPSAGLSSLSSILGPLAAGAGGFAIGSGLGKMLPNQGTATLGGAASGAATGAAIGSIIPGIGTALGAVIGGIAGGGGGLFGKRSEQKGEKARFRQEDVNSQRDQIFEVGNIGDRFLVQFGADQNTRQEWETFVNHQAKISESGPRRFSALGVTGTADQGQAVARVLGHTLLPLAQAQGFNTLDDVPELRSTFIDYMVQNTFSASNSSYGGGAARNLIARLADIANL